MIGPIAISIPTCIAVAAASGIAAFARVLPAVVLVVVAVVVVIAVVVVVDVGTSSGARWGYVVPVTRAAAAGPKSLHETPPT